MLIHPDTQLPTWNEPGFSLGPLFAAYCGIPITPLAPVEGEWDYEIRNLNPLLSPNGEGPLWVGCPDRALRYSHQGNAPLCIGMPAVYLTPQKVNRPPNSTILLVDALDQKMTDVASFLKSYQIERGEHRTVIAVPETPSDSDKEVAKTLWRQGVPVIQYNSSNFSSRGLYDLDTLFHRFETVAADHPRQAIAHAAWRGCRIALKTNGKEPSLFADIKIPRRRNGTWKSESLGAAMLGESLRISPETMGSAFGWPKQETHSTPLSLADIFGDPELRAAERAARILFKNCSADIVSDLKAHADREPLIGKVLEALKESNEKTLSKPAPSPVLNEVLSSLRTFYPCLQEAPGKVLLISASAKSEMDRDSMMLHRSFKSLKRANPRSLVSLDITYQNKLGLAELYNQKIDQYLSDDFTFLVFCHDDVYLDDHQIAAKLHSARIQFGFDIVGLAGGSSPVVASPTLWHLMCEKKTHRGAVNHPTFDGSSLAMNVYGKSPAPVDIVDGLFIAVNVAAIKATGWRFNTHYRFHHYDLASCIDAKRLGMRTGVYPIHVVHSSLGLKSSEDSEWKRSEAAFLSEFGSRR